MVQTAWLWVPWVAMLSAVGLAAAWFSWRKGRRGAAVTWLGWATVPWAAFLLGLIALGFRVIDAVGDWATRFAFNPAAWVGLVLAVLSAVLIAGGNRLQARAPRAKKSAPAVRDSAASAGGAGGSGDPQLDEIEEILKKRGIG